MILKLNNIAKPHHQQSFAVFNRSTKYKATYIARAIPDAHIYAKDYDESLETYLETLVGIQLDERMNLQVSIPVGKGGLGINISSENYCTQQHIDCLAITHPLVQNIAHGDPMSMVNNSKLLKSLRTSKQKYWACKCEEFVKKLNPTEQIRFEELNMKGVN